MAITAAYKREFIRKVFRDAAGDPPSNTELIAVLDDLSDAALSVANSNRGAGKILIGSSSPEGSASWQALGNVKGGLDAQIELIDAVRSLIGTDSDLDTILNRANGIKSFGVSFSKTNPFS
ncbi:hypothetical protein MLD52_09100 [Puniceicoccaceae bacterium K14]|nr:hypothetical protein [Puniceicoccaceae bacterium K14]